MRKCERCHYDAGDDRPLWLIWHNREQRYITLCENCNHFISQLFDDVIDEYVLRKE